MSVCMFPSELNFPSVYYILNRCSMCALGAFFFIFFFPFQSGSASGLDLFPLHVGQETMGRRWLGASDKEMGSRWIMQRWKWALSPHSAISKSKENCGNPAREFISCQMIVKSKLELQVVFFFFSSMFFRGRINKTCLRTLCWPLFLSHSLYFHFVFKAFFFLPLDMDACLVSAGHVSCCSLGGHAGFVCCG